MRAYSWFFKMGDKVRYEQDIVMQISCSTLSADHIGLRMMLDAMYDQNQQIKNNPSRLFDLFLHRVRTQYGIP